MRSFHVLCLLGCLTLSRVWAQAPDSSAAIPQPAGVAGQSEGDNPSGMVKENPSDALYQDARKGWFFYEHPKKPPEPTSSPTAPPPAAPPPASKEQRCQKMDSWTVDCGFIDPGTSFEFQAKERDALLKGMAMSKNDPKAVEAFQYYQKWVLDKAVEIANLWYYNTVQNPDLDANAKNPINAFGLKLMTEVKDSSQTSILAALRREEAFYVYFSRHDCSFCLSMAPILSQVKQSTGLEIWNAALDSTCMPGYEKHCMAGEAVQAPAQALQVTIVPTLFLYVPPNTWIRVSTGVTDEATIRARTTSFFSAYRSALLKGVQNGDGTRAPVDFSDAEATGTASGVKADGPARLPTEDEIKSLLKNK